MLAGADHIDLDSRRGGAREQRDADEKRDLGQRDDESDKVSRYPDPRLQLIFYQQTGPADRSLRTATNARPGLL